MASKKTKLRSVYWDVDDVVLNSLETAVNIINKKYNIPNNLPEKTINDVKDWNLKSINNSMTQEIIEDIFASDDFWNDVKIRDEYTNILTKPIMSKYRHYFVTKGSQANLEKKLDFLQENFKFFNDFEFYGLDNGTSKSIMDMSNGIFIDDNIENLMESNAAIKILLTNGLKTVYNNAFGDYKELNDIYYCDTLEEVKQFLDFNLEYSLVDLK